MSEDGEKRWMYYTGAFGMAGAVVAYVAPILIEWLYSDQNADCFKSGVVGGRNIVSQFLNNGNVDPDDLVPLSHVHDDEDECIRAFHDGYNIGVTQVNHIAQERVAPALAAVGISAYAYLLFMKRKNATTATRAA